MMSPDVLWHDGCVRCGCAATWHQVALDDNPLSDDARWPCSGWEFRGCILGCDDFVHDSTAGEGNDG